MTLDPNLKLSVTGKYTNSPIGPIPADWNVGILGDYAYIKARIGWRGLSSSEYTDEGAYLIAGNHIDGSKIKWDHCDHLSEYRYEESKEIQLQKSDIIISKDGTIGRLGFIDFLPGPATINGTMMLIRPDSNHLYPKFIYYYFQGSYFQRIIQEKVSGSSVPHIFQRDMVKLLIPLFSIQEQKKIAAILSSVDDAIQAMQAVIDQTRTFKQGLLQQLLTRGIGHTRFKQTEIGEIPKEWDVVKIKDACYVNKQSIKSSTDKNYEINYIDIASIEYTGCNPERKKMLLKEAPSRARRVVNCSNILVSTVRPNLRGFTFIENAEENLVCSTGFAVLESKDHYSSRYIYQFVLSDLFLKQVSQKLVGSNYPAVNNDDLENVRIIVPDTIEEQKKIAQILSEIDSQLECNKNYLFNIQEIKRGLMQDLLSGRVRLELDGEGAT